jgi:hypothetical protein
MRVISTSSSRRLCARKNALDCHGISSPLWLGGANALKVTIVSPLRTDSLPLVSKIYWPQNADDAIMDAP